MGVCVGWGGNHRYILSNYGILMTTLNSINCYKTRELGQTKQHATKLK